MPNPDHATTEADPTRRAAAAGSGASPSPAAADTVNAAPHAPLVALVGLGPLGVALGQALARVRTRFAIHGHDRDPARVRAALDQGAIDHGQWNLAALAEAADLLIVAEPLAECLETLPVVARHARPGALVTDTAAAKARVMARAADVVPPGVSFIGGHPIPLRALESPGSDRGTAFQGATWCLMPLAGASDDAVRVLHDLVESVGARPFFIDPDEHDALVAGASLVPGLVAAAVLRVLDASPSAPDLRRLTGAGVAALCDAATAGGVDAVPAADAVGPWLDRVIAELAAVRAEVGAGGGVEPIDYTLADAAALAAAWRGEPPPDAVGAATAAAFDEAERGASWRSLLFGRRRDRGGRRGD